MTANGPHAAALHRDAGDPAADVEIRKVVLAVLAILQAESPNLFGDYELVQLPDGTQAAQTKYRKV